MNIGYGWGVIWTESIGCEQINRELDFVMNRNNLGTCILKLSCFLIISTYKKLARQFMNSEVHELSFNL